MLPAANDVLRNDVMLRINDVALRANGISPSCLEKHRKLCYNESKKGGGDVKRKKIIAICSFLLLILVTATAFLIAAIDSYNYDMDPANGVDIMEGMGAAFLIIIGGFVILCELDLFFTVYYFLVKPKTLLKSICITLSQLMLLLVFFSEKLAHFLFEHVSDIFGEEVIVVIPIFFFYVISRIICIAICYSKNE